MLNLGSLDLVPRKYVKQASKCWWKYTIPQFFPAYKPLEIEEWPVDVIMEHLAAISEMERQKQKAVEK